MNDFTQFAVTFVLAVVSSILAHFCLSRFLTAKANRQLFLTRNEALWQGWADRIFLIMVLGYVVVFSSLAILRYLTFHTGYTQAGLPYSDSWDLGQYHQIIWNSLHGRLFENTYIRDADSFLGKSFSPILLALVPVYAVWSDPIVLLFVQAMAVGASGFPIYWFARSQLGRPLALVVALVFYLSPSVENIVLVEFHEIVLSTPILSYATFFLLRRNYRAFLICLGLAFLVKEEMAFIAIALGIFILLCQRHWKLGLAVSAIGAVWGVLLLQYVIPFFRGAEFGSAFYYFGQGAIGGGGTRYNYLGSSLPEILITLVTRPDMVMQHLLVPDKIEYLLHLFVPLAFVPLIGAEVVVLALPTLGYSLLSNYALQYSIRSYYYSPLLPFLFFALVVGLQRLLSWSHQAKLIPGWNRALATRPYTLKGALSVLLLVSSGVSYLSQGPGPGGRYFEQERYSLDAHAILGNQLVRAIPVDATVVAQNELLGHVSGRKYVYEIPIPDYRRVDYLFADASRPWYQVHEEFWKRYLATGYFETVANEDGYLLAKRKAPDLTLRIHFLDLITFLGYSILPTDTLRGGMAIRPVISLEANTKVPESYRIEVRIVDAQGHLWAQEDREPHDGTFPTNEWKVDEPVGDQYTLRLPPTMPAGNYQLTVSAHREAGNSYLKAYDEFGNLLGTEADFATVRIEKNKSSFTAGELAKEQPLVAFFVDMQEMRLLGYVPPRQTIGPGELLQVGLYWRAREKPRGDYVVAVQLRDAEGNVVSEHDSRPANGTYSTRLWDAGEVLLDWHDFTLPNNIAHGDYQIFVTLRDEEHGRTLGETGISLISVVH